MYSKLAGTVAKMQTCKLVIGLVEIKDQSSILLDGCVISKGRHMRKVLQLERTARQWVADSCGV